MLLYNVFNLLLFEILELVFLQVKTNLGTAAKRDTLGVRGNGEGTSSCGFPDILFVVVVLTDDLHPLCD